MKRILPIIAAAACGACVTIIEPPLSPQAVQAGQRTVFMVFPSPGPWVVSDTESKAESAAKSLPLFSGVVQSVQDERDLAAAKDLRRYLPRWGPEVLIQPMLLDALAQAGFPGKLISPAEGDISTDALRGYNRSIDVLDWQKSYFHDDPARPHARNYSTNLSLDDALIFEVNLLPSVASDDDGNMVPTMSAKSRLFRAQTMRLLWKNEDSVEDRANAKSLYEFKTLPLQLVDRWKALLPGLAAKVADGWRATRSGGQGAPPPMPPGGPPPEKIIPQQPPQPVNPFTTPGVWKSSAPFGQRGPSGQDNP